MKKEGVKPDHFYNKFDVEWKVVGKCDRTEEYEIRVVNKGTFSKTRAFICSDSSSCPSIYGSTDAPGS